MTQRILNFCVVIVVAFGCVFYWYRLVRRPVPPYSKVPQVKWTKYFSSMDGFYTSPTVGKDGELYIAGSEIYCVDPSSALRWEYRVDLHDMIEGAIFQDEERNIYFGTTNKVYSLTQAGLKRWEASCPMQKMASSDQGGTSDGSTVYTICGQSFSAFNKEDGTLRWSLPTLDYNNSPVMLKDGEVAFVRERRIFVVDRNGKTLWSYPRVSLAGFGVPADSSTDTYVDTPIAVGEGGTIYGGSQLYKFVALDTQGQVRWTYDSGNKAGFQISPVIAADGTIIAVSMQDVVHAFAPEDGAVKWTFRLPQTRNRSRHSAPVLGSDGTIYIMAETRLVALTDKGHILWDLPLQGTGIGSPALAPDGTMYIAMAEGTLYAVQTGSHGLMQSAWPKFQHDSLNSGRAAGAGDK
ncbi:MAG: PQQ-binding-like beta-propeller repeat protein [Candidatus Acidiferrales bacterium]